MQLFLPVLNQMPMQQITDLISYLTNYNTLIFIVSKFYGAGKFIKVKILVLFKRNSFLIKKICRMHSIQSGSDAFAADIGGSSACSSFLLG
jgi:hypothetical protein